MRRILPVLALAVIALAAVLVVNTLRFTSRQVADGYVWGRGAMDDKSGVLGILEAVETLVAEGVLPVPHPIAFVGIAEKGSLSLELSVDGEGGHSSMPPAQTAIGMLGAAVGRLEAHPMSGGIHGVARQTLDHVGPEMS